MTILGEIIELSNQVYKIWAEQDNKNRLEPQEVFTKYIEPSYMLLKEIHSDYLDLYFELFERIDLERKLSVKTIRWFSKARTRRQADRAELSLLDIPEIRGELFRTKRKGKENKLNIAIRDYLISLHDYFLPDDSKPTMGLYGIQTSEKHILMETWTHSFETEQRLINMLGWLELSYENQLLLLAEEYLVDQHEDLPFGFVHDEIIEVVLKVAQNKNSQLLPRLEKLSTTRTNNARQEVDKMYSGKIPSKYLKEAKSYIGKHEKKTLWRYIVEGHIQKKLYSIQSGMRDVQRSYMRVRILTDK